MKIFSPAPGEILASFPVESSTGLDLLLHERFVSDTSLNTRQQAERERAGRC